MKVLLLLAALVATPAWGQVTVENAWARATPPGAKIAAGYLMVHNSSATPDRLVSASSHSAEKVETHVTIKEGDVSRMRQVKGYDVPANGMLELAPGGAHLMLVNIKAPLKEGDKVPLVLRFEKAGEVKTELAVRALGAPAHGAMHMQH
jgi:copper(I)-binding protein